MPKMIHKQKNPFGGEVYTDENFNVIGYGRKDSLGREVFLDKDFRYVGEKEKNLFEDPDKDRKGNSPSVNTVYTERDYRYLGKVGKPECRKYVWLNRQRSGRGKSGLVVFLAALFAVAGIALWLVLR